MTTRTDLIPAAEIARLVGVSRQRAHAMASGGVRNGVPFSPIDGFPEPAVVSSLGKLWRRVDVEAFLATWERLPGRPRKPEAELSDRVRARRRRMAERAAGG